MQLLFVRAFLYKDDQCLLARRCNTGFGDGLYSMIGGAVQNTETALQAIVRKVQLEIGATMSPDLFSFVHMLHLKSSDDGKPRILLCFAAAISGIVFCNTDPDRCDDVRFFDCNQLPENMLPAHKQIIECIQKDIYYSELGW